MHIFIILQTIEGKGVSYLFVFSPISVSKYPGKSNLRRKLLFWFKVQDKSTANQSKAVKAVGH